MLISLRSDHKEHLQLLTQQPVQVIIDFCKLSIDFLQNGSNLKRYTTAAQKLNVEVEVVQNCVYGIINLLLVSCKHKLSEADFRDSVLTLGFTQEQEEVLGKLYESKQNDIIELNKLSINDSHYHDLQWRFEAQVASRSLLNQAVPIITMDLVLKKYKQDSPEVEKQHHLLQTDPNNLLHIASELENALMESRSRHSRKIQKALSNK